VFVVGSLAIGGAERQASRLAIEFATAGHAVGVVALMEGGPLAADLVDAGVAVQVLGLDGLVARRADGRIAVRGTVARLTQVLQLAWQFRRDRVDVVHASLLWPSAISLTAAALARVPVRISARHNLGTDVGGRIYPRVERMTSRLSHHVIAVSSAVAGAVARQGTEASKILVIYNGVAPQRAARAVDRQPARGVIVANLIAYKGHEDLIDALASMADPPMMDVVGDGTERARLEQLVADRGLGDVVQFRGVVADPRPYYERAQFSVLASHEEGLGIAVLEAMAAGLPVVATAVGGVLEILRDGETGLLVPAHDPPALARAIATLAADPARRVQLGRSARADVQARFSWGDCVARHDMLYRSALAAAARA
jgi:glycosyltransferase involved in cell wall biosynthesis